MGGVILLDKAGPAPAPPSIATLEMGRTGLVRQSGKVQEEFLPQLRGRYALKTFKEMAWNDPVVSGMLFAVEMFIRQADWYFVPPELPDGEELSDEDRTNTDFANSLLEDMSHTWQEFLSEALTMLPFGFAPFEIIYKVRDGDNEDSRRNSRFTDRRIGWRKLAIRAQDTIDEWHWDEAGGLTGLTQFIPAESFRQVIPIEKLVIFRIRPYKNNPEGQSILRGAYRPWYIKKRVEEDEAIGIERDLKGMPMVTVPAEWKAPGASDAQKAAVAEYEQLVARARRNEMSGLVIPAMYDRNNNQILKFELVSTNSTRNHDTDKIIQRWDTRVALSILAQFIITGLQSNTGSFALASSQTHAFSVATGAVMDSIAETTNRHAMPKLWRLNGLPMDRIPQLRHGDIESPDLRDLGNYLLRLHDSGQPIPRDAAFAEQLLRLAGLDGRVGPELGEPPAELHPVAPAGGEPVRGAPQARDAARRQPRNRLPAQNGAGPAT